MKKYKIVKQEYLKDCGAASLESIIEYYDGYVPLEILRQMTKTTKDGVSAYNLVEAAKKLGFNSYGIKTDLNSNLILPAIAYIVKNDKYKHFVVIYEVNFKKNTIVIMDPAIGIKKYKINEFNKIFQNVLIIMYPIKKIEKYKKNNMFLKEIKKIIIKNIKKIILIILISILFVFLNLIYMFYLKKLLNIQNVYNVFIVLLLIIFFKETINFIKNKLIINFSNEINYDITNNVFFKIIKLPYQYYRNKTSGEIISRLNDLEKILYFLTNILINLFLDLLIIISVSIILFSINKILFFYSLSILVIYLINNLIFKKRIIKSLEQVKASYDKNYSNIYESITAFETIKGLNLEDNFIFKFKTSFKEYILNLKKLENISNLENSFKNLISYLYLLLLLFIGIKNITISELLIYNTFLSFFIEPIKNIYENATSIKETKILINRINELYYNELVIQNIEKINNISINLNNEIYKNVNFKINKNDKLVLIGKSGSGKSTMLKLIKKYYESNILINDKIKPNNNIIYVSQNEFLFNDTIYNNIVLNRNIKIEEFKKVMDICEIDDLVKDKSLRYNELIEENGFNISGGEKQRIVLARTLLSNASVILLDESLCEVDNNLERKMLKKILKLDKTIIFVSHRLDNIDLFDKVLKLENKKLKILERRDSCENII